MQLWALAKQVLTLTPDSAVVRALFMRDKNGRPLPPLHRDPLQALRMPSL